MSEGAYQRVRVEIKENGVAEVILNRPQVLNVMDHVFFDEIGVVMNDLDKDDRVNAILLWAEGRLFTAGLDLKSAGSALGGGSNSQIEENVKFFNSVRAWQQSFNTPRTIRKPVIAAIHNKCIGGGIDLITACDIRIATKDASFSIKETQIGIVADLGTLQRLNKIVGNGIAREMAFTASDLSAERALQVGFVNAVYENKEALLEAGRALAARIASLSPLVVQGTKVVLNYAEEHSVEDSLFQVALWNAAFIKSDDAVEAMMAFMEKRPAKFRNRL